MLPLALAVISRPKCDRDLRILCDPETLRCFPPRDDVRGSGWESRNRDRGPTVCLSRLAANPISQVPKLGPGEVSGLPEATRKVVGRDMSSDPNDSGAALLPRYREAGAFFFFYSCVS